MPNLCSDFSGGDLGVGLGIDIRIDAKRDTGRGAARTCNLAQRAKLGLRLDIEAENAGIERKRHLGARLADPGEDDLPRRHTSRQRPVYLAFRNDVSAGAELRERADDGEVGVGLDRIADKRVAGRERLGEDAVMPLDRRRGIAIETACRQRAQSRRAARPRHAGCRSGSRNDAFEQARCV